MPEINIYLYELTDDQNYVAQAEIPEQNIIFPRGSAEQAKRDAAIFATSEGATTIHIHEGRPAKPAPLGFSRRK